MRVVCGDDDDGVCVTTVGVKRCADSVAGRFVEIARRLVSEDEAWFFYQRARQSDALLLAARKMIDRMRRAFFQPDSFQCCCRALPTLSGRHAADEERERDVFQRRQVRQQVMKLKDEAHFRVAIAREPCAARARDDEITEPDESAVRRFEAAEQVQQR